MAAEPQFLILLDRTIHHEGDERSRTHPGHGYPAYDETVTSVEEIADKPALIAWLKTNAKRSNPKHVRVYECKPVSFSTEIQIEVKHG